MKPTIRLLILFFIVWGCSPQLGPQEVARIGRVVVAPADLYEILPKARFEAAPQERKTPGTFTKPLPGNGSPRRRYKRASANGKMFKTRFKDCTIGAMWTPLFNDGSGNPF